MDPSLQHKRQLEYYDYYEKQKKNFVDLTQNHNDTNSSIFELAKILFAKSSKNLDQDLTGLILDPSMDTADIFCMLIELVLYGIHILTNGSVTIFDLEKTSEDMVYKINSYVNSIGLDMIIGECTDSVLVYSRDDFYCEIVPREHDKYFPNYCGWHILDYHMICNSKFVFTQSSGLDNFKALFVPKNRKIFAVGFKWKRAHV
jgi:hypothetical protein